MERSCEDSAEVLTGAEDLIPCVIVTEILSAIILSMYDV
jgi:hypothetical protein